MFRTPFSKEKNEITLRLTTGNLVGFAMFVLMALAVWRVKGLLLVILTAVVFASFIDGMTEWLRLKNIPRAPAVMMIYLITIGIFGGILYMFLPVFLDELSGLLTLLPPDSTVMSLLGAFAEGGILNSGDPMIVLGQLRELYQSLSGNFLQGTSNVFGGIINIILILVISFYLAVQERGIEKFLRIVTPQQNEKYVIDVWRRTKRKIGLWFQGQLLLALVIGVLTYMGLLLIGVPYALLLSLLSGAFALVPFGAFIAIVPSALIAFSAGGWSMALLVGGLFLIIQQFENYLFQPLIIQRATGVPSIIVLISLVFGIKLFGFLGLFLSIPAAVLALELLQDYENIKLASRKTPV